MTSLPLTMTSLPLTMTSYEDEAIAIVGVGCVTPGASNLEEFWRVLVNGENHVVEIPPERWNVDAYFDPDPMAPGKSYVRKAGLIKSPDEWDNRLYGINDFEMNQTDPQQRLVLDCTHMALENAGITRAELAGSNTGVYVGAMNSDYRGLFTAASTNVGNYTATGVSNSIISARVSYVFDLRGPSMTIDTACSSALVSVHLGVQAIRAGDCDLAICGGTNYLTLPDVFVHLSKAHMMSPTGQCHAFSDKADGYTRGEGCGMIILKKLKDALRDGDNIWATVITGSNQDGRSVSPMTAPSMTQQVKLLEKVYQHPAIDVDKVDYVEAHGTGTPAGDPIEANAIGNFFKNNGLVSRKRYIGTVKTNLGHLESAAGAVGIIKVLLMMKHSQIVPSLHFSKENPNPRIDFDDLQLEVPTEVVDWPTENKVACASSFGFGGTNSHVVLIEYRRPRAEINGDLESLSKKPCIVCISANSEKSLNGSIHDLLNCVGVRHFDIHDISFTSTCRRDHHILRVAKVVEEVQDLVTSLEEHMRSGSKAANTLKKPRVVFVFCGMGTNWKGMCKDMMIEFPVFLQEMKEIDRLLSFYVQWSLVKRLEDESYNEDPEFSPLAIFACQVALARLWQSLGIQPQCIVGQSVGEVAAAHIAGSLTLEDAVKVIYFRTHHLAKVTGGKMLIVRNMSEEEVMKHIDAHKGKVNIGLHYSPISCALSGDADNINAIKKSLLSASRANSKQVQLVDLQVPVAYHSHHVASCEGPFEESLAGLQPSEPIIDIISTVTGELMTEAPDVDYWVQNMRMPVLFHQAISKSVEAKQKNVFIEIGPKPVLRAHIADIFSGDEPRCVMSMSKQPEHSIFLAAVAAMYEQGADLEWSKLPTRGKNVTTIPRYSFNRQKSLGLSEAGVTILAGISPIYRKHAYVFPIEGDFRLISMISPHGQTSLYDHVVSGVIVVPGAYYVEVGLGIAQHLSTSKLKWAVSVDFEQPLVIQRDSIFRIDIEFSKGLVGEERAKAPIKLIKDGKVLATLRLRNLDSDMGSMASVLNLAHIQGRCKINISKDEIYASLRRFGFQYGEAFSLITTALKSDTECLATMRLPAFLKEELTGLYIHPSILDSMLQSSVIIMSGHTDATDVLPRSIKWFVVHRQVEDVMLIHTVLKQAGHKETVCDVTLLTTHGVVIAELEGLVIRSITEGRVGLDDMYNCDWKKMNDVPGIFSVSPSEGENIIFVTDTVSTPLESELSQNSQIRLSKNGALALKEDDSSEEKKDNTTEKMAIFKEHEDKIFQYNIFDNVYNQLPLGLDKLINKNKSIQAIALLCFSSFDESRDADILQEQITYISFLIKNILVYAGEHGLNIPVFVCTNKAWPSPESKTSFHTVNPLMTSLWGMTRCALREQLYPNLITVEVQVPDQYRSIGFMQRALSILFNQKSLQHFPEFLVTPGAIYVNQLVQVESEMFNVTHRKLFADADKNALLLCQDPLLASKPFAIFYEKPPTNKSKETETITIKTEAFAVHHPGFFSMSVPCSQMLDTLRTLERGCPIFSMEVLGTCLQDPEEKLVCFYPVAVSTQITVPKFAAIKGSSIPDYQIGDLSKIILVWILQLQVQTHQVTLLTSNRNKHLSGLLEGLLKKRKIDKKTPVVSIVQVEEINSDTTFLDTILSLVFLDGNVVSSIAKRWNTGKHLLTCKSLMSNDGHSALLYLLPDIEVQVLDTKEFFHPHNLQTVVPTFKKWLKKLDGFLSKIVEPLHKGFPASIPSGILLPPGMASGSPGNMGMSLPPGITLDMIPPEMLPPGLMPLGMMVPGSPVSFSHSGEIITPEMMSLGMNIYEKMPLGTGPSGMMPPGMLPPGMMPPGMGLPGMPPGMGPLGMPPGMGPPGMPPGMGPPGMLPGMGPPGMPPGMGPPGMSPVMGPSGMPLGMGPPGMPPGMGPPGMMPTGMGPPGMMPPGMGPPGMMPPGMGLPNGFPGGPSQSTEVLRRSHKSPLHVITPSKRRTWEAADMNQLLAVDKKGLEHVLVHATQEELFRGDSIYAVVGGLTGLGWVTVKYLAEHGAGIVVIINRRSPSMEQSNRIELLKNEHSCQIIPLQADVTSLSSLQTLFRTLEMTFPSARLKGVFYGAAVIDDSILLNMDPGKFRKVLSPKVKGIWNFHLMTKGLHLDYFVMQSSVTSVVGNGGQCHYGAGNAFMDGLAYYRRSLGLAAQSINWGVLDLGMLDSNSGVRQSLEAQGFILLTALDIQNILTPIFMLDWPQIMPCRFDREKLAVRIQRDMQLYLQKRLQTLMPQTTSNFQIDNQILQSVHNARNMDPEKRKEIYEMYITALASQVLSIDPSMVTPDGSLTDLGMDSITAMTMISQIARETQVRLPAIIFISGNPSPKSIAQAISDSIDGKLEAFEDDGSSLKIKEIEDDKDTSPPVSPIEAHQLSWYKRTPRKQSMHGTVDIALSYEHTNLESVQSAVLSVLAKHPTARSVFNENAFNAKGKFKRSILNPNEIFDLRVIEDINGVEDTLQTMSEEIFDTEKSGPVRFILIKKPSPKLRIVFHKVGFDLKSTSILVQDLIENLDKSQAHDDALALLNKDDKHEEMKTFSLEMEKVYADKAEDFYRFWEQLGHKEYTSTTLGLENAKARDDVSGNGMVSIFLKPSLVQKLTSFIKQHQVSLFGVITSCHQILLHVLTGKKVIPLIFPLDLRRYFSTLGRGVGNYCNEIPLVAEFNAPQETLQQFVLTNNKMIDRYVSNGMLPFTMFHNLADHILSLFNETPHGVSIDLLSRDSQCRKVEAISLPSDLETNLSIQHDLDHGLVSLTITYKNSVLNRHKAWVWLKCLSRMVNKSVSRPKMTIARVEGQCRKLKKKLRRH